VTDFATASERLLTQVRHWEQPRWSAAGRGDRVFTLVQLLADLTAEAEGRPCREVPRAPDMVLPDQLRVMTDDLLAAGAAEPTLRKAHEAVDAVRHAL
jgi:hypothetical protein